jgi:hypothetical protein
MMDVDFGPVQQLCRCVGDLLVLVIKAASAINPVEVLMGEWL